MIEVAVAVAAAVVVVETGSVSGGCGDDYGCDDGYVTWTSNVNSNASLAVKNGDVMKTMMMIKVAVMCGHYCLRL